MSNLRKGSIAILMGLTALGCAHEEVHKENIVGMPVTVALAMCPEAGTVGYSKGKEGERMLCERSLHIGTHVPTCTCRDEGFLAQQTIDTQELVRIIEKGYTPTSGGAGH